MLIKTNYNLSTNQNIANYYNQTLNHYQNWWRLDNNLAVHYGIWDSQTKNFQEALANTNKVLMNFADINEGDQVLDAGCGVGGSAFYLAKQKNARVEGITLSDKQYKYANIKCSKLNLQQLVTFSIQDYNNTNFENNKFDVIWAIESITSAPEKQKFAKEAYRLLKPGGRLIIADYFKSDKIKEDPQSLLEKWQNLWSMAPFLRTTEYGNIFKYCGFELTKSKNVTKNIAPTAKRMYWSYIFGGPFAVIYNIFNNPSSYARVW